MSIVITILAWLFAPVSESNADAALYVGSTDGACGTTFVWRKPTDCAERIHWQLTVIADRESVGSYADDLRWQGAHPTDGWAAASIRDNAERRGWMFDWCPWHDVDDNISTIGNHGLMFGYNAHRVAGELGPCFPSWLMSIPRVSAIAAARRVVDTCADPKRRDGWCPSIFAEMRARERRIQRGEATREGPPWAAAQAD